MPTSSADSLRRRLRLFHFNTWASRLEDSAVFSQRLPELDLTARTTDPHDPEQTRLIRFDCDWHGAVSQVLAVINHPELDFMAARVVGLPGLVDLARASRPADEEWWLVFEGCTPQKLAGSLGKLLPLLRRNGVHILYYAFDQASRVLPFFSEISPHLSLFIHDEPVPFSRVGLAQHCVCTRHHWGANLIPFLVPFHQQPDEKILFLGSPPLASDPRQKQIRHLQETFGSRFVAIHDHSVTVADLGTLNRFKVCFCPEGRGLSTSNTSTSHADRPFWSGCLGMVPVMETSVADPQDHPLAAAGLVVPYVHDDLDALTRACEEALAMSNDRRRKIYDHFNRHETIGTVVAEALAAFA